MKKFSGRIALIILFTSLCSSRCSLALELGDGWGNEIATLAIRDVADTVALDAAPVGTEIRLKLIIENLGDSPDWPFGLGPEMWLSSYFWDDTHELSQNAYSPDCDTIIFTPTKMQTYKYHAYARLSLNLSDFRNTNTADNDADSVGIESVTVISGATQSHVNGAKNWAAVKASGDAVVEAKTKPNTERAGKCVSWSGGSEVSGNLKQRKVSKSTSAKTTVTASCGTTSDYADIWIVWSSINISVTGTSAASGVQFFGMDESQNCGPVTFTKNGNTYGAGKMYGTVTFSPAGVESVLTDGWDIKRERISRDLVNGAKSQDYWEQSWQDDDKHNDDETLTPDSGGHIYVLDAPNVGRFATNSYETSNNFREWVNWNGDSASDYSYWHYHGRWQVDGNGNQSIPINDVGTGEMTLPAF